MGGGRGREWRSLPELESASPGNWSGMGREGQERMQVSGFETGRMVVHQLSEGSDPEEKTMSLKLNVLCLQGLGEPLIAIGPEM